MPFPLGFLSFSAHTSAACLEFFYRTSKWRCIRKMWQCMIRSGSLSLDKQTRQVYRSCRSSRIFWSCKCNASTLINIDSHPCCRLKDQIVSNCTVSINLYQFQVAKSTALGLQACSNFSMRVKSCWASETKLVGWSRNQATDTKWYKPKSPKAPGLWKKSFSVIQYS